MGSGMDGLEDRPLLDEAELKLRPWCMDKLESEAILDSRWGEVRTAFGGGL